MSQLSPIPAVSIVMPAWNSERFLQEALDSIRNQTFTDYELLLVDDGSTDRTLEIMERAACEDRRIRIIRMEHGGIVPALNKGVSEAKAEWIGRMDSDDLVYPDWLESIWAVKEKNPDAILFHSRLETFGDGPQHGIAKIPRSRGLYALKLCTHSVMAHPAVVFNKAAFFKAGGYDIRDRHTEDYALWGRLLEIGTFKGLAKINLKVRLHETSTTAQDRSTQTDHTIRVGRLHCTRFLNARDEDLERIHKTLGKQGTPADWLWFIGNYLPKLKWPSLEAIAWVGLQLVRSIFKSPFS